MGGKRKLTWHVQFHLQSDWLIKGATMDYRANASPLVDGLGRPYIPASTIKGLLRHQCRRLKPLFTLKTDVEALLFGMPQSAQGSLYIDDALLTGDHLANQLFIKRYRIAIDRKRRVVRDQAFFSEEVVSKEVILASEMTCYVKAEEADEILPFLTLCILQLKEIGSGKSIGRGKIHFKYDGQPGVQKDSSIVSAFVDDRKLDFDQMKELFNRLPLRI